MYYKMLSRLLRELLFTLIHLVMDILVAVQTFYQQFYTKKWKITHETTPKSVTEMLLEHRQRLSKAPKHLVFLADTDHHSFGDLAQIVIWALLTGIPYISFHDITGELKENENKLFQEVQRCKKGIPGCIKWANMPNLNGYTNGTQSHTVNINIFTHNDGKAKIVQCIKDIAEKKINFTENSDFTAQDLDKALSFIYPPIPEPELVLYTGLTCCTHGLLPWQIRLTEFIQLSIDYSINVNNFISALYKYSKCDQRFGK